MEKDKIFFAPAGYTGVQLTTTSANYIANMAKEAYRALDQELQSVAFYTTTVKLLDSSEINLLREGISSVSDIKQKLHDIAQLKSLIAWIREAIKAKERLITEAGNTSYEDYGLEPLSIPVRDTYLTEDDVIGTWGIKQRNRYYYLDTLCATIGQYIHPEGKYAEERDDLQKKLHEPNRIAGNGRDTMLYRYSPSVAPSAVEDTFMDLQQTYRGYQAELNSMKHQLQDTVQKDVTQKNLDYQQKMSEYKAAMDIINAQLKEHVHQAVLNAQNLKIIIPDSLKSIYDQVQSLGKK